MIFSKKYSQNKPSKGRQIEPDFFFRNRQRLLKQMAPESIALLGGNYPLYTNSDSVLPYVPNHDLWYFTGVEQDETLLFLIKGKKETEEILFIQYRDGEAEVWNGKRLSREEAGEISRVDRVKFIGEWEDELKLITSKIKTIYLNLQEHLRAPLYRNRNHDLFDHCKKYYPLHDYARLAPLIHPLRLVKTEAEIAEIRRATEVSRSALERIFPLLREGVAEKEIEAALTAEYIRHGGGPAYPPIIAGGENSCILHYITNRNHIKAGEVLLIDSGAQGGERQRYSADITRVFPVGKNGRGEFSPRQRQVYEAVERVLLKTSALVKPGVKIKDYREKSLKMVKEELAELGLLSRKDLADPSAHIKYFMHGVSHWLGLDVHDVGSYDGSFQAGQVLTCEPGIYIPEEKIGVRLENNLWIKSARETENLTASIPLGVEDLYQWMEE